MTDASERARGVMKRWIYHPEQDLLPNEEESLVAAITAALGAHAADARDLGPNAGEWCRAEDVRRERARADAAEARVRTLEALGTSCQECAVEATPAVGVTCDNCLSEAIGNHAGPRGVGAWPAAAELEEQMRAQDAALEGACKRVKQVMEAGAVRNQLLAAIKGENILGKGGQEP